MSNGSSWQAPGVRPAAGVPPSGADPASAPRSSLRPGDMIDGRYRIDGPLGDGGMSSLYRATHTVLDQPVAIKVVAPQMRYLHGMVARFLREARAATQMKGQHVVRVFDVGTTERVGPYMVMEYLDGRDLGAILRDGAPIPVEQAVDYIVQACEALAEAHGLGIIHRDLKPANLFVTRGTRGLPFVKLIDFGISRIDSPLVTGAKALTSPGVVMGSPGYMAPEQMLGTVKIDARADIWGLGAVLYELLTRRRPFDGETLQATYVAAMVTPAKPSALREGVPPGLDEVVLRCLKPVASKRYANVAELTAALLPFGSGQLPVRAHDVALILETARARAGDDDPMAWDAGTTAPSAPVRGARGRTRIVSSVLVAALAGVFGFGASRVVQKVVPSETPASRTPIFAFDRAVSRAPDPVVEIPAAATRTARIVLPVITITGRPAANVSAVDAGAGLADDDPAKVEEEP